MNINQLKYFIALVKHRSFSVAAQKMEVSQPALSLQIQKLEEEFEYKLIDRNRKPLSLTTEGKLFFEKAQTIVQLVEDLSQLSLDIEEQVAGKIRIGIIPTLSPYLTPVFINKLQQLYPRLLPEIIELNTQEIINMLRYNELDMGILATPVTARNIGFVPLFYERFYLYVSDKHPLSGQDKIKPDVLDAGELWYLREGNCFQNQVDSICKIPDIKESDFSFRYISYSIESLKRMVETHGGMTFIPELATMNVPAEYEDMVKTLDEPVPFREISIAYLKTTGLKKSVEILANLITESVPPRMRTRPASRPVSIKLNF